MIHCPNCNRLINKNTKFCPHCGLKLQQSSIKPYHHHHIFRNIIVIILLLIIGFGGADIVNKHMNNHNARTSRMTNNSQQNSSRDNSNSSSNTQSQNTESSNQSNNKPATNSESNEKANQSVNKPGYTLSEFPSNIQGTWYTYDNGGGLFTLTINNNSMSGNDTTNPLHARSIHASHVSKHPNWMICLPPRKIHGLPLVQTLGWNQGAGDGESFGVINYKGMTVLEEDGGAESWVDSNFFKSKAQAKQYKNKVLPHEIKR